jgi:hypothetical protein
MRRTTLMSAALLIFPLALSAQSHPLVGEWKVDLVVGGRMGNGGAVEPLRGTGTLTVQAVGDSLVATMAIDSVAGRPMRPPTRMATALKAGEVIFVSRGTATLSMNGESREAVSVSTYTFRVNGDALDGTMARALEGVEGVQLPAQPPQPVTGVRKKP